MNSGGTEEHIIVIYVSNGEPVEWPLLSQLWMTHLHEHGVQTFATNNKEQPTVWTRLQNSPKTNVGQLSIRV